MNSELLEKKSLNLDLKKTSFKESEFAKSAKNTELISKRNFLRDFIKPLYDQTAPCYEVTYGDLKNAHGSKSEKCTKKETSYNVVAVKKLKPLNTPKPRKVKVSVAIPAPPDAPLRKPKFQQDLKDPSRVLKFRPDGRIVPHSILGSVEDFLKEAGKSGTDKEKLSIWSGQKAAQKMMEECQGGQGRLGKMNNKLLEESKPLRHWRKRMFQRMCQQNYLSCILMRPVEHLAMNQGELMRQVNESRTMIDLVAPFVEHGKGDRRGSEFWQDPIMIRGDQGCSQLCSTLIHGQRGYESTMSFVDIPDFIQCCEKGLDRSKLLTSIHRPWLKSIYLKDRLGKLSGLFYELNPYMPQTRELMVIGCNYNNLRGGVPEPQEERSIRHMSQWNFSGAVQKFDDVDVTASLPTPICQQGVISNVRLKNKDVIENFVCSPALIFGDFKVAWHDPASTSTPCQKDVEVRVLFEACIGQRMDSRFQVVNNGCTSVYFRWKRLNICPSFVEERSTSSKFYFNPSQGIILPGEKRFFDCSFKSCEHGIYEEYWQLLTCPLICGAGRMVVTFRGNVLKPDHNIDERNQLIGETMRRASFQVVGDVVGGILCCLRETERPPSPPPSVFEEDQFADINHHMLVYGRQKCHELNKIYKETVALLKSLSKKEEEEEEEEEEEVLMTISNVGNEEEVEEEFPNKWDLDVASLKKLIMRLPEREDLKQDLLSRFNSIVVSMASHEFPALMRDHHYHNVHMDLCDAIERIDAISERERLFLKGSGTTPEVTDDAHKTGPKDEVKVKVQTVQKSPEPTVYEKLKSKERFYTMAYNVVCEFIENIVLNRHGVKLQCNVPHAVPVTNEQNV